MHQQVGEKNSWIKEEKKLTAKEIEAFVNRDQLFKRETSSRHMEKNEQLRIWVEYKTNNLKKQSIKNHIKWTSAVAVDQNY